MTNISSLPVREAMIEAARVVADDVLAGNSEIRALEASDGDTSVEVAIRVRGPLPRSEREALAWALEESLSPVARTVLGRWRWRS
jgi:hypothetical protein